MKVKVYYLLALMSFSVIMLAGCQSASDSSKADSSQSSSEKVAKTAAKVAVKAAVRHSPVAIIKAVK